MSKKEDAHLLEVVVSVTKVVVVLIACREKEEFSRSFSRRIKRAGKHTHVICERNRSREKSDREMSRSFTFVEIELTL